MTNVDIADLRVKLLQALRDAAATLAALDHIDVEVLQILANAKGALTALDMLEDLPPNTPHDVSRAVDLLERSGSPWLRR